MLLTAAERRGVPVAYVTGLRIRRASQIYEGTAKTDPKDAWVLADYARRNTDSASSGGGNQFGNWSACGL